MKTVKDVMTTNIHYCTPLDNVYEVAVLMKDYGIGVVPICEEGILLGMITDRDIAIRGVGSKRPGSTKVTDIMSENLVTISPNTSIDEAAEIMSDEQIRRLPVVEGNRLVGMVSLGDLAVRKNYEHEASQALSEISENHSEWQH
ncbi:MULTISPECIES: CBS domain-containing protein [Bacillus]|uniref:CBS domain-containing protein n=1 Tax=Bacillus TaxID=1386 RepID=UPI0003137A9C|nr:MULTISPECIES: CBS domain-containing protein [Bacillus]